MKKVYLLLRNNVQTGPYSQNELLKQGLRSSDLIWVEGESHAWSYPNEIEDLGTSLNGASKNGAITTQSTTGGVSENVSRPKRMDEIEERAEEIRKKVLSYKSVYPSFRIRMEEPDGAYPAYNYRENIDLVYHRKKRGFKLPVSELVAGAAVAAMLTAVWYKGGDVFPQKTPDLVVATQMVSTSQHNAQAPAKVPQAQVPVPAPLPADTVALAYTAPVKKKKKAETAIRPDTQDLALTQTPDVSAANFQQGTEPEVKKTEASGAASEEKKREEKKAEEKRADEKVAEAKKENTPVTAEEDSKEKKKTLGDVFKGIFKKKKKDADKEATASAPKENR